MFQFQLDSNIAQKNQSRHTGRSPPSTKLVLHHLEKQIPTQCDGQKARDIPEQLGISSDAKYPVPQHAMHSSSVLVVGKLGAVQGLALDIDCESV